MAFTSGTQHTEIGVLPDDWAVVTLRDVADSLDHLRVPVNESERAAREGDYPYCGANGVLGTIDDFVIDDDVVLIAEDGGNFDDYMTRPIAYRMRGKCWVNNHAHVLRAKDGIDPGFLLRLLEHRDVRRHLASGTRAKLNKSEMWKIQVQLPPSLSEQERIAEALSDVDCLIEGLERLIVKKRNVMKGTAQALLSGGTRLPGHHGRWCKKNLGDAAEVTMGQSPPSAAYNDEGNGLPLVQGNADIKNRRTIIRSWTSDWTKACKEGDIIMTVRAPVGSVAIASSDICLGRGVCALSSKIDAGFLFHSLVSRESEWGRLAQGSTFTAANGQQVKGFTILAPESVEEQRAIAEVLTDMDVEIEALEKRLAKTRDLKTGMAQELLSGRTRLV